jgi:hypothetical protein
MKRRHYVLVWHSAKDSTLQELKNNRPVFRSPGRSRSHEVISFEVLAEIPFLLFPYEKEENCFLTLPFFPRNFFISSVLIFSE